MKFCIKCKILQNNKQNQLTCFVSDDSVISLRKSVQAISQYQITK